MDQYFASATGLSSVLTRHEKCFGSRPAYFDDDKKAWAEAIRACRQLADSQAWLELLRDAADSG
jgi:hypothetical protein